MEFLYDTSKLLQIIYRFLQNIWERFNLPEPLLGLLIMISVAGILVSIVSVIVMALIWLERKVSAHIQDRLGPMRVGPHGILQSIADALKLLTKESLIPKNADKFLFALSPILVFTVAFMGYLVIPFDQNLVAKDLNIGILYILAISGMTSISLMLGGWSSNNKYSLLGGLRSTAQIISYEIPVVLAVVGVVMAAGSLQMTKIVSAQQSLWFICWQPVGFFVFLIGSIAEINRVPFDLPEAESELIGGFHTEYSGMKFAMFFLAEFANMFLISAICTTLFLGGSSGLWLPPILWFFIKTGVLIFLMMLFRWTFPRYRVDQLMSIGWKFLLPLAFINIAWVGGVILWFS